MPLAVGDSKRMLLGHVLNILLLMLQRDQPQVIISSPTNVTVFVNETAHFSCEVSSGCARWRFDGHFFYELPLDVRKDIEISCISPMSYLDILARPSYDGMTVQCVIADIGGGIKAKSENATLHVLTGATSDVTPTVPSTVSEPDENVTATSSQVTTGASTVPHSENGPDENVTTTSGQMTTGEGESDVPSATAPDFSDDSKLGTPIVAVIIVSIVISMLILAVLVFVIFKCSMRKGRQHRISDVELGGDDQRVAQTIYSLISPTVTSDITASEAPVPEQSGDEVNHKPEQGEGEVNHEPEQGEGEVNHEPEQGEDRQEETFDTSMTSTERGGDCGTVPGHSPTRQLPSPRIDESRGSKTAMSAIEDPKSFKESTFCDEESLKNGKAENKGEGLEVVTDIILGEGDASVTGISVPLEENGDRVSESEEEEASDDEDDMSSSSVSEEETDSDGDVLMPNGRTHSVGNLPQQSGGCFLIPPLSPSYSNDVRISVFADQPVVPSAEGKDNGVRLVSDEEQEPVLVTVNNHRMVDKKVEGGQKDPSNAAPPAATRRDSGEVAHSSVTVEKPRCHNDVHVKGTPLLETDTGPVQPPTTTTKPPKNMKPLGDAHHLQPVGGKCGGAKKKGPPPQQRERLRHKKKKKKRSKPKPAIPQDVGPSASGPVEEERERSSLSSSPDAVD